MTFPPIARLLRSQLFFTLLATFALTARGQAIDSLWTNGSNDGSWFNVANWTAGIPNGAGDSATIRTSSSTTNGPVLTLDATLGELNFQYRGNRAAISGDDVLTFDQPGAEPAIIRLGSSSSLYDVTLGAPIAIADGETLNLEVNSNGRLRLDGPIVSTGGNLVKLGPQELTLTAPSPNWGGEFRAEDGKVVVENVEALGSIAGKTIVRSGSHLVFVSGDIAEPLSIDGGIIEFGEGDSNRTPVQNVTGAIELVDSATLLHRRIGSYTHISGQISGIGGLQIEITETTSGGNPTFVLSGDNSYDGETIFSGLSFRDELHVESPTALGNASVGTIVEEGRLNFRATVAEPLDIRGGIVSFGKGHATTGDIKLSGGQLLLSDIPLQGTIHLDNQGLDPLLRGGQGTELRGGLTGSGELLISGTLEINDQPLSHDGGLRIVDGPDVNNGGVQLNVANSFTGNTVIEKGTLIVNHSEALGVADSPVQVLQDGAFVLKTSVDREMQIGGQLVIRDPAVTLDETIYLGGQIEYFHQPAIIGVGTFNGEIKFTSAPFARPSLVGGIFNGPITGSAERMTISPAELIELNGDNTHTAIAYVSGPGVVEVNSPTGLGSSDQGTNVERGSVQLNVATEEPIVVVEEGRVDVNTQQVRLPRLMGSERSLPPRLQILAINHAGVYGESVDVVEGALEVNANATLGGAVVRELGQLRIADGATLNLGGSELELRSGSVSGRLAEVPRIRKVSGIAASVSNLHDFDGDIVVEKGKLITSGPDAFGTTAGATHVMGPDSVLALDDTENRDFSENIFLHNTMGDGATPGLRVGRVFSNPDIRLSGRLDLGSEGSSIGGLLELAGEVTGGNLVSHGRLSVRTPHANHTGGTDVVEGAIVLLGEGRLNNTSAIRLHEASESLEGKLELNNREEKRDDRIPDTVPIEFLGGALESKGHLNEAVGALRFIEGNSEIDLFPSSTEITFDKRLTALRLERNAGAVATIHVSPTAQAHLVEQSDLATGIMPWLLAVDHRSTSDRRTGFAVLSERGIVPLENYETDFMAATPASNMQFSRETVLASDTHVNSITGSSETVNLDLNRNLLTVESGGILSASVSNGRITAGAASNYELILPRTARMNASIVDNGDNAVSVTAIGELSGNNSYSGTTYVNEGTTTFTSSRSLPANTNLDVSGGTVQLNFGTGVPKKLKTIRIAEGGSLESPFRDRIALDFDELLLEKGGFGGVTIVGEGTIRKTTPGSVSFAVEQSSTFSGDIIVEAGYLEAFAFDADPRFIVRGGMLGLVAAGNSTIELAGGDLRVGDSFFNAIVNSPEGVINVSEASRIVIQASNRPQAVISHPIIGNGDLTFTGRAVVSNGTNATEEPRAHRVRINTGNPEYSGDVMIDTITVSVGDSTSLGSGRIHVGPAGRLQLDSGYEQNVAIQNDLYLSGGEIRGYAKGFEQQITGPLHISRDARIGGLEVLGQMFLQDRARLTVIGDSLTQFRGELFIGGYVELEHGTKFIDLNDPRTETGATHLTGTVRADATDAVLNLIDRGLDDLVFEVELETSSGKSLTLLKDGKPMKTELSGTGTGISGDGTFRGEVTLTGGATISPGASPGVLTIDGVATIGPGAVYDWELANIAGGAGVAWDLLQVEGPLNFTATPEAPWVFDIMELNNSLAFKDNEWLVAAADEIVGFDPSAVDIVASNVNSTFQRSMGDRFALEARGAELYLVLTVPEPSTVAMMACVAAMGFTLSRWRGRSGMC